MHKRLAAVSMIEVLMVLAALLVLAAIFLPVMLRPPQAHRAPRIQCVNNLKQAGLAMRVWAGDNNDTYPMFVSQTNGGSMEFTNGANAWRHFLVMSNELSTPKVLFCPAESDLKRVRADVFGSVPGPGMIPFLSNSNISFFVGIVSNEMNPELILSGDHNLTNGAAVKNAMLELTPSQPVGWTTEMHNQLGNVGLADGSVQQVGNAALRSLLASSGAATNLLQMPVLTP
jgi:hypothetical protein